MPPIESYKKGLHMLGLISYKAVISIFTLIWIIGLRIVKNILNIEIALSYPNLESLVVKIFLGPIATK